MVDTLLTLLPSFGPGSQGGRGGWGWREGEGWGWRGGRTVGEEGDRETEAGEGGGDDIRGDT